MEVFTQMGLWIWSAVVVVFFHACDGQNVFNPPPMLITVGVVVNGSTKIAETNQNFICATLDWWPPEKCDYGRCSWIKSSILNLDLKNPSFAKAIKAFGPLKVRLGGTLQDKLLYDIGPLSQPYHPFTRNTSLMFGFSKGCLTMSRWDEVNIFLAKSGAMVMFGLNALYGRYQISKGHWGGNWDPSNARNLIQYTVDHGYNIYAWEFGNELSGSGIGARVDANLYATDIIMLSKILKEIYNHSHEKPLLVAPDGFFDPSWFQAILQETGPNVLNAVTRHIYNLGAGVDKNLTTKILDPSVLNKETIKFRRMQEIVHKYGPWSSSWVGEAGGAFNSGQHLVSDAFINIFWFLDQLGMSAAFDTKVYCRQSLIGGNYALLNATTFEPNPDYYSALLWHRLMGRAVLSTNFTGPTYLRSYAHCAKSDVCGFDLLRCQGRSYVCDVNGWSFVKNSYKYYDDAACVLRKMFLDAKAPHLSSTIPPSLPWKATEPTQPSGLTRQGSSAIIGTFGQSEELRCVIAVMRHGDRTPKQKVKLKVTQERLLNLMLKYNGGKPRAEG